VTTPVVNTPVPAAPQPPLKKKKNRKKLIKNIVVAVIAVAVVSVGAFFVWKFAFANAKPTGNVLTDFATRGSISNKVTGNGFARANKSATITLAAAGNVQEVFVTAGQMVAEGDPLFVISSAAAEKVVDDAKKRVEDLNKEAVNRQKSLAALNEDLAKLHKELDEILAEQDKSEVERYIRAPFAGQLRECAKPTVGNDMTKGTKLAVLADDSKLRLSLYFSYAYEGKISVGQQANVSVTSSMASLQGTVEEVNYVRKISDEGSTLFEAVIVIQNPGALKEKLAATATLTGSDGTAILPYAGGSLELYRTADILTKTDGKLLTENLLDYSDLKEGDVIAVLDKETFSDRIQSKNLQIETKKTEIKTANEAIAAAGIVYKEAQAKVTESQKALADFSAVAPMGGTVVDCALQPGNEVASGTMAVTISDNAIMTIDLKVDERNIKYVKKGMNIEFQGWDGGSYMGTVDSVGVVGKNENGVTTYPAVVKV
ncbi:MAG: HlyD family efflux transporter periplasmic adaptor subunit, partial [Oscillospiraceae bacterium]